MNKPWGTRTNPPHPWVGPRYEVLREIQPAGPSFARVVSYHMYRLGNIDQNIGRDVLADTSDHSKHLKHLLGGQKFDRTDPIAIVPSFSAHKKLYNNNRVSEGAAFILLPHFLSGEAREQFEANFELGEVGNERFTSYPGAVHFFCCARMSHIVR